MPAQVNAEFDAEGKNHDHDDAGFTLIELMVVVLVIAILLAIAIPTFLGARERSQDRAAQSNLRNALTAAKVLFVDSGTYAGATTTNLGNIEPGLSFLGSTVVSDAENKISVEISSSSTIWAAAAKSDSGTCWLIKDDSDSTGATGGTGYFSATTGDCDANVATARTISATTRSFPTG